MVLIILIVSHQKHPSKPVRVLSFALISKCGCGHGAMESVARTSRMTGVSRCYFRLLCYWNSVTEGVQFTHPHHIIAVA